MHHARTTSWATPTSAAQSAIVSHLPVNDRRLLYAAAGQAPFDWRVVPPFTIAAALFAGTVIFYFRWTSRWADRLAHNDLEVQQYASDILRASWVAELLFEYKDEQDKEIPAEVIARMTEGLFHRREFGAHAYHPSEDLASMIGGIRKIKATPSGVEIDTNLKK